MAAQITDAELREELVAFGVDVGPISATTRSLWLKKLDKLNAEKRKNRRASAVPNGDGPGLGNFSSDPDEDYDVTMPRSRPHNNNNTKNGRQSGRHDAAASSKGDSGPEKNGVTKTKSAARKSLSSSNAQALAGPSSTTAIATAVTTANTVIPGVANLKNATTREPHPPTTTKTSTSTLMKKYLRELEEGEISDTDSENDRKLANGKKERKAPSNRKSTTASAATTTTTTTATATSKPTARASSSETEVKTYLKSIQDSVKPPAGSAKNEKIDRATKPCTASAFTRAFPDVPTYTPSTDPTTTMTHVAFQASTLISGRPAISRQRPSISSSDVAGAGVIGSSNRGTTTTTSANADSKLNLNDTVIYDPHNNLPAECRPRLSMSSIGPRSSTPYNGHLSQKIDPLAQRKVSGVNGLASRETSDGPLARPSTPPPSKYQTTDEELLSKEFKTSSEGFMSIYSHYISVVIVILAAGFFLLLTLAYLNLFSYDSVADKPLLRLSDINSETDKLVGIALEELRNVAIRFNCRETAESSITVAKLKSLLKTDNDFHLFDIFAQLRKFLPDEDPDFNLKLLFHDESGTETTVDADLHSIQAVTDYLPIKCRLYRFMGHFAIVAISGLFLWMIVRYIRNRKRVLEEKRKKLFVMVDSILDFLTKQSQARYTESGELSPVFAISHVRDALIAPVDRDALSACWSEACEFINKNESRVREETKLIKGEEYLVWRWVADPRAQLASTSTSPTITPTKPKEEAASEVSKGSIAASLVSQAVPPSDADFAAPAPEPSSTSSSSTTIPSSSAAAPPPSVANQWQGQAFQNIRLNAPPYSLTQCLKIRNMFDPDVHHDPTLKIRIQDAILEKCGPSAHVQHVAINVDKVSREGCVYVKCRDAESAGVAYRALHGWWYDGKLVSVKYLPLKRYHERFPDTAYASTLLQPSSFKL